MVGYGVVANKDGSVTRLSVLKLTSNSDFVDGVASKDIILDDTTRLWARIFLPSPSSVAHPPGSKLPLLLCFHGGGFVMMSVAFKPYHSFFSKLCKAAMAIVVAVEYRLAPEHRLPAAHDDAYASLKWLQRQAAAGASEQVDTWLAKFADFRRCYLIGDSSGGNMVYHLSLRISLAQESIHPLFIQGQIIVQPFFGGQARTESELRLMNDEIVPLSATDWLWRTCLPLGADRDHPIANPFLPSSPDLSSLSLPPTLIIVSSRDPLYDRQIQLFNRLKEAGVPVRLIQYENSHTFYLRNEPNSELFILDVAAFLSSHSNPVSKL